MANGNKIYASFHDEIEDILKKYTENRTVDSFNMFCMLHSEKSENRHTYFLKNLLDPKYPHHLELKFFKEFCDGLFNYPPKHQNFPTNKEIINNNSKSNIQCEKDLYDLFKDNFDIRTEKTIANKKINDAGEEESEIGRLDIIIESIETNSVIIIENKIDSKSHSDQLSKYQKKYNNYENKIFVYLTTIGELPINRGGKGNVNNDWCIYDYSQIVSNIKSVSKTIKSRTDYDKYVKKTLEDYCKMVNKKVLSEDDKWNILSKEKGRYVPAIIELYDAYQNKHKNLKYCYDFIKGALGNDFCEGTGSYVDSTFHFYTKKIEQFYINHKKTFDQGHWFCGTNGDLQCGLDSKRDRAIEQYVQKMPSPKNTVLLTNLEWISPLSSIKTILDNKLTEAVNRIKKLDNLIP